VRHSLIRLLLVALLALGTGALVACGSDDEGSSSNDKASSTPAEKKIKVAMVTDIGGLNDRGFNALAYKGLQQAKADLGAEIRVVTSKSNADYVPNLSSLARQKYDLVVAVGFLMGDATDKVAKAFPQTNFAIVDFPSGALKSKPKNVHGLLFKEAEPGYLAGYMAGLYVKKKGGEQVVSAVGGQKVPAVDAYAAGWAAGAKKANPDVKTLFAYSQDFVDQAKCKEIALNQIDQGSQVVFAVAGQCGLGALDAAKEKGGDQVVSSVGGQDVPAVQAYIAGYEAAAKKANPGVKTITAYSQDFVDQAKCKEIALNQIDEGSQVVFAVAGQCGLGALDAAKEKGKQGIGVDADQGYLGDHIMTSALKKVDEAAFSASQQVQDGSFKPGTDTVFDVKSGGVGYGETNTEGAKYTDQVDEVLAQIESGEITDIPITPSK